MKMSFQITDRVVLVTGANRGIGKSIVETFLAHGVKKVYAGVRELSKAKDLVELGQGKVVPIIIDLADRATIDWAAADAKDVELVVNNAGIARTTSLFSEQVYESLDEELKVNLYGVIAMARAFAPVLKANGGGAFVQLNSVVSIKSFGDFATYSASKAAAYSVTQAIRDGLREQGTLVVSVHPGPIATDMAAAVGLLEVADPPAVVSEGIVQALAQGQFHVFPDKMAKQFWGVYENYARNIVEGPGTVE